MCKIENPHLEMSSPGGGSQRREKKMYVLLGSGYIGEYGRKEE